MEWFARSRMLETGETRRQTASEHCRNAARHAAGCLAAAGLSDAGYLAGLLHDAGKFKAQFQQYLAGEGGARGSVNHTFAGCRMLLEHFHGERSERPEDVTAELLAYAAGAHHGAFDCVDPQGASGFLRREEKEDIHYMESRDHFLACCAGWPELEARFAAAHRQLDALYATLLRLSDANGDTARAEFSFYLGVTARLLLSAVIEGDRRDAADFDAGPAPLADPPDWREFWRVRLHRMEGKLSQFSRERPIDRARAEISDQCRRAAELPGGVFRLQVPTGGGKTLSALRYALAHAAAWGKRRILFVTPLLAILEQNAQVIRRALDDDPGILEHHSNVIPVREDADELDPRELAAENWHAPIIITTLVQLLNTLFLGKTTSIRRFQSLCDAVIVLDEVQTVPRHMLTMFNLTVNFLSQVCGATFVLCSATQPCFERAAHPLLGEPKPLVSLTPAERAPFCRTRVTDAGAMRLEALPAFVREVLAQTDSLLVVCNKKSQAAFLAERLAGAADHCFHLSAAMCPAHRSATLEHIGRALAGRGKTLCVSTQVMEAGVDLSFRRVIRLAAGMDSVVQAAGRCNRNGEDPAPAAVYLVPCADENLGAMREMQEAKRVTISLLEALRADPAAFGHDPASDEAVQWYYRHLYGGMEAGAQDYPLARERDTLFNLLGGNTGNYTPACGFYGRYTLAQAFATAGSLFHALEEDTQDAVAPYAAGADLIEELAAQRVCTPAFLRDWSRRARPFTVAIRPYQAQRLGGSLRCVHGVLTLRPEVYDPVLGLTPAAGEIYLEV